jgi:hypothetical protein
VKATVQTQRTYTLTLTDVEATRLVLLTSDSPIIAAIQKALADVDRDEEDAVAADHSYDKDEDVPF